MTITKTTPAAPAATTLERPATEDPRVMRLGEHEVLLPENARNPIELLTCFDDVELNAYADCCSAGLEGNEKVPPRDLAKFIWRCVRSGFDPFSGEVVGIWRFDNRVGKKVMVWQPEVRGYMAVAKRAGRLVGFSDPEWGPLVDTDVTIEKQRVTKKLPEWCKVTITYLKPDGTQDKLTKQIWSEEFFEHKNNVWNVKFRFMLEKRTKHHAMLEALADLWGEGGGSRGRGGDEDAEEDDDQDERPRARAPREEVPPIPVQRAPKPIPAGVKVGAAAASAPAEGASS